MEFDEFQERCEDKGLEARKCHATHWQVLHNGTRLVDYWPTKRKYRACWPDAKCFTFGPLAAISEALHTQARLADKAAALKNGRDCDCPSSVTVTVVDEPTLPAPDWHDRVTGPGLWWIEHLNGGIDGWSAVRAQRELCGPEVRCYGPRPFPPAPPAYVAPKPLPKLGRRFRCKTMDGEHATGIEHANGRVCVAIGDRQVDSMSMHEAQGLAMSDHNCISADSIEWVDE